MATNVGTLSINIQAGTAQFDEAMNKVQQGLKSAVVTGSAIGSVIGNMFTKLTEQAGELAREMYEFARSVIDTDEQMGNLAQVTGTTSEKFSVLAYAGKLANVSTEELSQSMSHLAKQMALAASGNAQAIELFQALGVKVTDANGKVRDTGDVFADVAKKFSQYRDDANKTDLAQQALGRSSARMIPYLNSLGANFGEVTQKAKEMNVVTGEDAAKQASKFNEQLADMQEKMRGTARTILNPLLPAINGFIAGIGDAVTEVGKLIEKLDDLGKTKIAVGSQQYQVVDVVKAADQIKKEQDEEQVDRLKELWSFLTTKAGLNLGAWWTDSVRQVLGAIPAIPKPSDDLKALQSYVEAAKKAREEAEKNKPKGTTTDTKPSFKLPPDPELARSAQMYQERLKQLTNATAAQRMLNEVIGQGSEAQAVANGFNEAQNIILQLNAARIEKKQHLLTKEEEQNLKTAAVTSELTKLQTNLGLSFDEQAKSADLAFQQQQNLTAAAGQGADAMEAAQLKNLELAAKYNKALDLLGDKGPAVLKQLADFWKRTADLQREAQSKEQVQQIQNQTNALQDEVAAINAMTAAIFQSDAAQQQAERSALVARQRREVDLAEQQNASQAAIDKLKEQQKVALDALDAQHKAETLQRARQDLQDPEQVQRQREANLRDEAAALEAFQQQALTTGQALEYTARIREANLQKLHTQAQTLLEVGGAREGFQAFFLELQANAKTTAQTIYDELTQAFEGIADYLAKVMTGTKASFTDLMRSIAEMLAKSAITNLLTNLLTSKGAGGSGLLSTLGGLLGGHRQSGGPISSDKAWIVGERGPEMLTGVSGFVHSATATRGMLGGAGTVVNYAIDARGTDPVLTERRTRAAIIAAHQSSVVTSIQGNTELTKRRPPQHL